MTSTGKIEPEEVEELYQAALLLGWPMRYEETHDFVAAMLSKEGLDLWCRWYAPTQTYRPPFEQQGYRDIKKWIKYEAAHFVMLHREYGLHRGVTNG